MERTVRIAGAIALLVGPVLFLGQNVWGEPPALVKEVQEVFERQQQIFRIRRSYHLKKLSLQEARTQLYPLIEAEVHRSLEAGNLDRRIADRMQALERWKQLREDPAPLVQTRIAALLDNERAKQRTYELQTLEQMGLKGHGADKKQAQQTLSVYRAIVDYHKGKLALEAARKRLEPFVREDVEAERAQGIFDERMTEIEQELAQLKGFKENPKLWVQHRIDKLLTRQTDLAAQEDKTR